MCAVRETQEVFGPAESRHPFCLPRTTRHWALLRAGRCAGPGTQHCQSKSMSLSPAVVSSLVEEVLSSKQTDTFRITSPVELPEAPPQGGGWKASLRQRAVSAALTSLDVCALG